MKKVLGLDIGVASIGWAFINEPEKETEQYSIVQMGSRIIPLNPDESDEFTKGNAISKNANRRIKRGMRRGGHRYKMRKWKLKNLLTELDMKPADELFKLNSLDLYELREKGVTEKMTLQELGRIFYHLNQKRGYKSNRKANNEEETVQEVKNLKEGEEAITKKKGYLDLINDREILIKQRGLTIGQYFYQELQQNPFFRIKENIFLRASYQDEFNKIWQKQKGYYPKELSDANYKKFFSEIIYFQRPLKSQKNLISECRFEFTYAKDKQGKILKDEKGVAKIIRPKVIAKSSPLFQIAKIWQDINNLKIRSKSGDNVTLTLEQKKELFDFLNLTDKISITQLKKKLKLTPADDYYINLKKDSLEGNKTISSIRKALSNEREDILEFKITTQTKQVVTQLTGEAIEQPVILSDFEKEPLFRLWHLLYSVEEAETLIKNLQEDFTLTEQQAKSLSKIDFNKGGYGAISTKAYRKIIPHLMNGLMYSTACEAAGYRHSDYLTNEENSVRPLLNKLELYSKNTLRNPVVEKIINQVINLVNAIISDEQLGRPDEIRVELGRELKQSAEERNRTFSNITKKDKRHKGIVERLQQELGFKAVSRRDIERVKLWEEFGGVSPYEPNKTITLKQLFNGDYEIEHIIPRSRFFDDSFSNKTISSKQFNVKKDNATGFDYIESLGEQAFHNYTEFVKKNFYRKDGISRTKLNYLLMSGDNIPQDFINRQMRETAYIAREVKNLLMNVCRNVYSTSGGVTDYLRDNWGINNILQQLNFEKYKAVEQTEIITIEKEDGSTHQKEIIKNWSKRDDHRHHAIDALVVALTKQSYINKLNLLNQNYKTQKELKESGRRFQEPWKGFVNDAMNATENILVSFKAGKKVATKNINQIKKGKQIVKELVSLTPRGFLHKETVYGQIKRFEKIKLSPKFTQWDIIANPSIKKQLEERLAAFGGDSKKAFKDSDKDPIPPYLKEITVFRKEFVVRYNIDTNFKAADAEFIVDERIKKVVKERLSEHNNNPKEAFKNLSENPIWLNKDNQIFIKAVRCFTGLSDLTPLHKNEEDEPIDFVSTRNNHHIAIYKDSEGKLQENAVTFWDALERKKNNISVIIKKPKVVWDKILEKGFDNQEILQKLPKDNWEFLTSLSQNEMFVFGLTKEDFDKAIKEMNYKLISNHLYRVQKIANTDYVFRHHLETKIDDSESSKTVRKYIRIKSLPKMIAFKAKINNLGKIVKEYE